MSSRRRRVTVAATAVAIASGGAAGFFTFTPRATADPDLPRPSVAVLSPRRAPEAFSRMIAGTRLATRVDALMRALPATSCLVVRADDAPVFSLRPDQALTPASALKLTTAAAFLAKVGGKGHFTTTVGYGRVGADGTVDSLAMIGDGDPLLATPGYVATRKHEPRPATDFASLASKLRDAGVRRVTGAILVNDGAFDSERRVPTWSPGYTATGDVGPLGALAVNDGFSSYAPLVAAPDPAIAAGEALRAELAALGVTVAGATRREAVSTNRFGNEVSVESAPYVDVVGEMLRESDNNTAELLLKKLARPRGDGVATRAQGVAARVAALKSLGIGADDVRAIDGSGLDRSDRATCDALVTALTAKPGGYDLENMLAVAGQTGTLDDRFRSSPLAGKLRAKTGSLDGVTALVGVADTSAAVKLRFAFIANGAFSDAGGKALQDRLVAALATYPEAPATAALSP